MTRVVMQLEDCHDRAPGTAVEVRIYRREIYLVFHEKRAFGYSPDLEGEDQQ
jgi:hypothetical protein